MIGDLLLKEKCKVRKVIEFFVVEIIEKYGV